MKLETQGLYLIRSKIIFYFGYDISVSKTQRLLHQMKQGWKVAAKDGKFSEYELNVITNKKISI